MPQLSRRSQRQVLSDGEDDDDHAIMVGPFAGSRRLSRGSVSSDVVSLPPDTDYASSGDYDMEGGRNERDDDDDDIEVSKGHARNKVKSLQPSTQVRVYCPFILMSTHTKYCRIVDYLHRLQATLASTLCQATIQRQTPSLPRCLFRSSLSFQ